MAVTVNECEQQDLPVHADGIGYKEHCSIDFSAFNEKEIKKKGKVLTIQAVTRNWLFQDE